MSQIKPKLQNIINIPNTKPKKISPLQPLIKWIKLAGFFGCPTRVKQNTETLQFEVATRPYWRMFAAFAFVMCLQFIIYSIFYLFGFGIWTMYVKLWENGLTGTDTTAMAGIIVPMMFAGAFFSIAFVGAADKMTSFSLELEGLKGIDLTESDILDHFSICTRRLCILGVAMTLSAVLTAVNGFEVMKESIQWSPAAYYVGMVTYTLLLGVCYSPPGLTLAFLVLQQSLGMIEIALKKCVTKIEILKKGGKEVDVKDIVGSSLQLAKILDLAEEAFGKMIFTDVFASTICGTFGCFFGGLVFTAFSDGKFNQVLLLCGLSMICIGVVGVTRVVHLLGKGQGIENQVNKVKRLFRDVLLNRSIGDEEDRDAIFNLLDRWSAPAPVRPCDTFDLNQSTGISICGVLLTYTIVLLQFKFGG